MTILSKLQLALYGSEKCYCLHINQNALWNIQSVGNILNPVSSHNASWFIYKQQHLSEPCNATLIDSRYIWRVTKMYCQDRYRKSGKLEELQYVKDSRFTLIPCPKCIPHCNHTYQCHWRVCVIRMLFVIFFSIWHISHKITNLTMGIAL